MNTSFHSDPVREIENSLEITLPQDYRSFLAKAHNFILKRRVFCRILKDNYRTDGIIDEFLTTDNFISSNEHREHLIEFQEHFKNPVSYVEAQFLYFIGVGSGCVCVATDGIHKGKIYSADNGDFGIIYQADNIHSFIESLYDPEEYRSTYIDLVEAVKANDLPKLKELVEHKDGNKLIEQSSWLDIELFEVAYRNEYHKILQYLVTKGYRGFGRVEYYRIKF